MHIDRELQVGRLVGLIQASLAIFVHTGPIGLVPKSDSSNRWRVIVDLSAPRHRSINDGISPEYCSLQYASIDDAVKLIMQLGRGT